MGGGGFPQLIYHSFGETDGGESTVQDSRRREGERKQVQVCMSTFTCREVSSPWWGPHVWQVTDDSIILLFFFRPPCKILLHTRLKDCGQRHRKGTFHLSCFCSRSPSSTQPVEEVPLPAYRRHSASIGRPHNEKKAAGIQPVCRLHTQCVTAVIMAHKIAHRDACD